MIRKRRRSSIEGFQNWRDAQSQPGWLRKKKNARSGGGICAKIFIVLSGTQFDWESTYGSSRDIRNIKWWKVRTVHRK